MSLSHYLEVCVPPSVHAVNTEGGSFVDVKEGDNATLECEADGIPRPTIHWVSTKARVIRKYFGRSYPRNKQTYFGRLVCLFIWGLLSGGNIVFVKEGKNATLVCEADGIPRPTIHWVSTKVASID